MSFGSTMKLGTLNYINPISHQRAPKEHLRIRLGSESEQQRVQHLLVPKQKRIQNARGCRFRIETDGFELLQGIVRPSYDSLHNSRSRYHALKELIVPRAVEIAKERFGLTPYYAHFTVPYLRQTSAEVDTRDHISGSAPHAMVHNDYGFGTFERMTLSDFYYKTIPDPHKRRHIQRQYQRAGRIMVIQFWMSAQPEGTVIENDCLALCHPRSIQATDLVSRLANGYNGFPGEFTILQAKDSPTHEWFYWSAMRTDESLVWIGYDSDWGDQMKPCFHTSFRDFSVGGRPRESVECRVILMFDEKIRPRL